jgi:addiction module HigA family antidote
LNLSVTEAAKNLGITRKTLSELLNGKAGISPMMALRLAKAFNTTPESWLAQQMHYDLWLARKNETSLHVNRLWKLKAEHKNPKSSA